MAFKQELTNYWTKRAGSYGEQHQEELHSGEKMRWRRLLQQQAALAERPLHRILEIGTGPGFIAILLNEMGYEVTAVDMTPEMLAQAKKNAAGADIDWQLMDGTQLPFADGEFDAVITRNVTWNLAQPRHAYQEWLRVIRPGGQLITFDANWYHYLYSKPEQEAYQEARQTTEAKHLHDYYQNTDVTTMERLARQMPLSQEVRPDWDQRVLSELGAAQVLVQSEINEAVYGPDKQVNFKFAPMFALSAFKPN